METETREHRELAELFARAEDAYEHDRMDEALKLFTEAAKSGSADACEYLGLIYRTGDGVSKLPEEARFWYAQQRILLNEMARNGDARAALKLGKIYQYGHNVPMDIDVAAEWIRIASALGNAEAMYHYANCFRYGWCGLQKDMEMYVGYLVLAAEHKYPEAQYYLGMQKLQNDFVEEGRVLIEASALQGFFLAQEYLQRAIRP